MSNSEPNSEPNSKVPLILTADTSSSRAGLALSAGREILGLIGLAGGERRSRQLLSEVDWLLTRLEQRIEEIDAFAVITGPGGFTGLRVGLATIKGFAHALNRPVVGLSTLEVYARAAGNSSLSCVLIDAHRGEVFAQLFAVADNGQLSTLTDVTIGKVSDVLAKLAEFQREQQAARVLFCGDGAMMHLTEIAEQASLYGQSFQAAKLLTGAQQGWIVQSPPAFLVETAAYYALDKFLAEQAVAADRIAADYIRPAEAEVKLKLGLLGKKSGS